MPEGHAIDIPFLLPRSPQKAAFFGKQSVKYTQLNLKIEQAGDEIHKVINSKNQGG
jgi:hypothetical protein